MNRIGSLIAAVVLAGASAAAVGQALPQSSAAPVAVPAIVAIPRPSEVELAIARKSFAQFTQNADAATRAVLNKYPALLEVRPPPPNTAIIPALAQQFQAKHDANREVARQGNSDLLFMGDSITDFWRNAEGANAGKAVLDAHFGQWKIANFGIAGDTTQGVLFRLQHGEGEGIRPRAIMLMIGTNNTARNSAAEVAEGIGAIVLELQRAFPRARILLLGVFPRGRPGDPTRAIIADINHSIARLHDGDRVQYLDIGAKFLEPDGSISREVMSDGLHPTSKGYEIWAQAVQEPLTKLMSAAAR